ncbi:MAG: tRNA epoxyqueuosine(34) reductase QueG [Deltaproteobacteria bacterium]|jgi:epoxyqueuosine reductase|nr:tRNA epoxyqueuosine(34) reductase QueG [Deltaproteobacteria bacterium]
MNLVDHAKKLGFVALGLSPSEKPLFFDAFCAWIDAEKFGGMAWLKRHQNLREDPSMLLPGCRTVISLAYPYSPYKPRTPEGFTMARYSEPQRKDYHIRVRKKAKHLALGLKESYPNTKSRVCVDSAPILERSFANRSGVGFFGKNNMLIVPGHGSYVFLTEILTTALLPGGDAEPMKNLCGNCTRCLDACPTGALEGPNRLNASRCLSYLTIEYEGGFDPKTGKRMGKCFLGCDVCQEVCPFNPGKKAVPPSLPSISEFLKTDDGKFETLFEQTALSRPGLQRIQRNIKAVLT